MTGKTFHMGVIPKKEARTQNSLLLAKRNLRFLKSILLERLIELNRNKNIPEFKYLGCGFSEDGKFGREFEHVE